MLRAVALLADARACARACGSSAADRRRSGCAPTPTSSGSATQVEIGAVPYDEMPEVFAIGLVHGAREPAARERAAAPVRRAARVLGGAVRAGPRRGDGRRPRHPRGRQRRDPRGARRAAATLFAPGDWPGLARACSRTARWRGRRASASSTRRSSSSATRPPRWRSGSRPRYDRVLAGGAGGARELGERLAGRALPREAGRALAAAAPRAPRAPRVAQQPLERGGDRAHVERVDVARRVAADLGQARDAATSRTGAPAAIASSTGSPKPS